RAHHNVHAREQLIFGFARVDDHDDLHALVRARELEVTRQFEHGEADLARLQDNVASRALRLEAALLEVPLLPAGRDLAALALRRDLDEGAERGQIEERARKVRRERVEIMRRDHRASTGYTQGRDASRV